MLFKAIKQLNMLATIFLSALLFCHCGGEQKNIDYRQEMRDFVINISKKAHESKADFIVVPQNGAELITADGEAGGEVALDYLAAIDGHGQEELFYGYDGADNVATPKEVTEELLALLELSKSRQKTILSTDYCSTAHNFASSFEQAVKAGFIEYVAFSRELDTIAPGHPYAENTDNINRLSDVKNFMYLINSQKFTRAEFLAAVAATNYDLIIMDLFDRDGRIFTPDEILPLKQKAGGGKRLILAYMSIGEAENYRYYWDKNWLSQPPEWLAKENSSWAGNYKVHYWDKNWQKIIFKSRDSYLQRIIDAGFDGVYLDIIDAFEYFE